jgi:LacI family transcriptional regulator
MFLYCALCATVHIGELFMAEKKVDQQTIADKIGVSRSTVTRVLRRDPVHRISAETRRLILSAADELGYHPRRRRTGNIALIVCGEFASFENEFHLATCEESAKSGYRVFLVRMPQMPSLKQLNGYVNSLSADGAIIMGATDPEVAQEMSRSIPVITVNQLKCRGRVDTVTVDYISLGRELTQLLIDSGHEQIAVIQSSGNVYWHRELEGFRQAMDAAGLRPDLSMVWSKAGVQYPRLLGEILSRSPRPTAILALTASDHALILTALAGMGVSVPRDLSYVGWAYSYMSALMAFPMITCLDDIHSSIAALAVKRLLDRNEDPSLPAEDFIAPVGIRRGETCLSRR